MQVQLKKCIQFNGLIAAWFDKPPRATKEDVWEHRQSCPICRENMRLCNLQAKGIKYPEETEAVTA